MNRLDQRGASLQMVLLAAIAVVIGVYLICTTELVAKDGLFYIDQARKLTGDLPQEPEIHLMGFPLMIGVFHNVLTACGMGSGISTWIVSAQAVSLLARVLCLVPVYFIGKRFVGQRRSIMGIFILVMLPLPAEWGADVLRDFPSLLLLLSCLAFLIAGAESRRIHFFALAGLACGVGVAIREELLQLVLYVMLWFAWRFITARNWPDRRRLIASGMIFLLILSLPALWQLYESNWRLPAKTGLLFRTLKNVEAPVIADAPPPSIANETLSFSGGSYKIVQMLGGNFHEYFYPFWIIGLISCLRRKGKPDAKFFLITMMIVTLALLYARYFLYFGGISKRYLLPISVGTIFFIPEGLRLVGLWIERFVRTRLKYNTFSRTIRSRIRTSTILLLIGIALCIPKLIQPIRWEKKYYAQAAELVAEVTEPGTKIWAFDKRICLYSDRTAIGNSKTGIGYTCEVTIHEGDPQANKQRDQKPGWKLMGTFKSTRASDRKYILVRKIDSQP
ncbi:MAG: glycosyltransferase family 39 protein [bacterium]|nr:glycosyltransferase family 39 protein [bacterium]